MRSLTGSPTGESLPTRSTQAGQDLTGLVTELLGSWKDGRIKLYLISRTLDFRRMHRRLFMDGNYLPLESAGDRADHVCAFARVLDEDIALAVVPRLGYRLTVGNGQPPMGSEVWRDTRLILPSDQAGRRYWRRCSPNFPVALLERVGG